MQEGILSKLNPRKPAEPYIHQPYPSVRYHRSGKTKLVHSDEEHAELVKDPDWADTPAAFDADADAPAPAPAADPADAPKKAKK